MTLAWNQILQPPATLGASQKLLDAFDAAFLVGFGRLGEDHLDAISSLQRVFSVTPLGDILSQALEAMERSEFSAALFQRLAAARSALQGAQYDALAAHLAQAFQHHLAEAPAPPAPPAEASQPIIQNLLEGVREWLTEIALSGFPALRMEALTPFVTTLEQLQEQPATTRLAMLLTGFLDELMRAIPITNASDVPLTRWVDMWTRAMLLASQLPPKLEATAIKGTFYPLGVDVHHHAFAFSYTLYGFLEQADQAPCWVYTTRSAYKVDLLQDDEAWQIFGKSDDLLEALSKQNTLQIEKASLSPDGFMRIESAKLGKPFSAQESAAAFFSPQAAKSLSFLRLAPLDRHPIQLAWPVMLDAAQIAKKEQEQLTLADGTTLRIALERISPISGIEEEHIKKLDASFGLLRYDNDGFAFQPLLLATGGKKPKTYSAGQDAAALTTAKRSETISVLKERSSRLLRKKS